MNLKITAASLLASAALAGTASAGSMVLGNSGWTASWDSSWDPYATLVVDAVTNDAVVIEKFVVFTQQSQLIDPFVIVFQQTSYDAVSNIVLNDEVVVNDTAVDWQAFRFILASGSNGMPDAAFDPAKTGIGAPGGFDISPFTVANYTASNTTLTVSGGTVPREPAGSDVWGPGQVDGALWIAVDAAPAQSGAFTVFSLKEQPFGRNPDVIPIPLPAAVWTGLSGLAALGVFGGYRRMRKA